MASYSGVLHFYSETGTEGGYWAFQDQSYMYLPPPDDKWCSRCGALWSAECPEPAPVFTYWREAHAHDGKRRSAGYYSYDGPHLDMSDGPGPGLDTILNMRHNANAAKCLAEGHLWQGPEQCYPDGVWSYEGLHVLHNGDRLTIWDTSHVSVVWRGVIDLRQHELFTEHTHGLWAHADQVGVDRDLWGEWFLSELPADLETPE